MGRVPGGPIATASTSLIGGALVGVAAGAICAALLWSLDAPLEVKITAVAIVTVVSGSVPGAWRIVKAAVTRFRVARARTQRRRNLAASRARDPRSRYGLEYEPATGAVEDETVMMGERTRSRLSGKHGATLLSQARNAAQTGDFHRAAAVYSDLLDGSPGQVEAHLERGRVYLDLGEYIRAMSDFVAAEDLEPDSPLPLVAIGDLHFARKDYTRAIECFDLALSIAPDHAMAWCRRGLSHAYRNHPEQALADLLHAKRFDPDIPNLDTHLASARRKATEKAGGKRKR